MNNGYFSTPCNSLLGISNPNNELQGCTKISVIHKTRLCILDGFCELDGQIGK